MSDSDDDVPLGQRKVLNSEKPAPPAAPAVIKHMIDDSDSSDDDVPVALKHANKQAAATKESTKPPPSTSAKKTSDSKPKATPSTTTKKEKAKQKEDKKPKSETKPKPKSETNTKSTSERIKKVFDMPGQTRETPGEDDALRKFYTSLLEQNPESEMARKWCAMTGLLSHKEAQAWVDEQAKKKGKSPTKNSAVRRPSSAATGNVKRKKSLADEDDFRSAKKKVAPKKKVATPKRDVAFADGGMDGSDSDDDVPLLQRIKK